MTTMAASSPPLIGYVVGIAAVFFWPFRKQMRVFRWGIVIALVALQLVMKAPVWFMIDHLDLTGGSSGYHRAMLVDQFIRNFGDWWLLGPNANPKCGYDLSDLSNHFVPEASTSRLAPFL